MTGIDDRCALSLKGYQHGIDSGPSVPTGSRRVIGLGGEERRGMKDRWGNAWGLESHLLSPLRLVFFFLPSSLSGEKYDVMQIPVDGSYVNIDPPFAGYMQRAY